MLDVRAGGTRSIVHGGARLYFSAPLDRRPTCLSLCEPMLSKTVPLGLMKRLSRLRVPHPKATRSLRGIRVLGLTAAAFVAMACSSGPNAAADVLAHSDATVIESDAPTADVPATDAQVADVTAPRDVAAPDGVTADDTTPDVAQREDTQDPVPNGPAQNDGFDGDALDDAWTVVNGDLAAIEVRDGSLWITPSRYSVWFHHEAGPGVVQEVTGNFAASTTVRARSVARPDEPPFTNFQFGGLIARDPASDAEETPENYVFSVVGYRGDYLSAETKSTINDASMVDGPPWPSGDAEIRICRVDDTFQLYIREIGADAWNLAIAYDRPDLPDTLQVGPIAYTYTDDVDLQASFEAVTYSPVSRLSDCVAE